MCRAGGWFIFRKLDGLFGSSVRPAHSRPERSSEEQVLVRAADRRRGNRLSNGRILYDEWRGRSR